MKSHVGVNHDGRFIVMSASSSFMTSSVGKKYFVALTAFVWTLFVLVHMLGNLLIFVGPEAYNLYSHTLITNPFIYLIEFVLLFCLIVHGSIALTLKIYNVRAKPKLYAVAPLGPKAAPLSSRTMAYTGTFILAFIIWHLASFKYGPYYTVVYNNVEMRDIYRLIVEKFHDPFYVVSYLVALILVGMHLFHGVKSMFQTLGVSHPRYNFGIKIFGYTYAVIVTAGFMAQPIYVYLAR